MHLKAKYPDKLFDLDGIGKQLDMSEFSKNFFSSKVTADASVDANANVDDVSVISYNIELPKPFFKLNSYYILWKELKRLYSLEIANTVVEMQLTGDIYIHDFHGFASGQPYSYYEKTVLIIKYKGNIIYTTIADFFNIFSKDFDVSNNGSFEEILLKDVEILDKNNSWTKVSRILRHKTDKRLIQLENKLGYTTIVTEDHPVIQENFSSKEASKMSMEDTMLVSNSNIPITEEKDIPEEYAYFVGFLIGDGYISLTKGKKVDFRSGGISICQKDILNSKIYSIASKLFNNVKITKNGRELSIANRDFAQQLLDTGIKSINRKFPVDILNWKKSSIKALIAGIIDAEGNINSKNGILTIRTISFELTQQLGELFRALNIGKTRTSFAGIYKSIHGYSSNNDIYRLTCRVEDKELIKYSEKISKNEELVFRKMSGIDGRFETSKMHKIVSWKQPEYVYDITTETGHFHCQGLIQHNCFNYSTYDILTKGLPMVKKVRSIPPKHLHAFKSQLEQFVIIASNSTLGATGLADLLIILSYFTKNILDTKTDAHYNFKTEEDCWIYVKEMITSFIYSVNFSLRANQSPFTNVSVYDKYFLEKIAGDYLFPDGSSPDIEIVQRIQKIFLETMNQEMKRTPLTYPVTTACFSVDEENNVLDKDFLKFIAKENQEFGFINIYCGKTSTLSSCCRLRSESDSEYFNSFGSGSSKIGSLGVCTINLPRLATKNKEDLPSFKKSIVEMVDICSKINNAKRKVVEKRIKNGNEPLYSLGFMELERQYSTVGLNGINECLEILGFNILDTNGQDFLLDTLDTINSENKKLEKYYGAPHNVEQVPGENMSIKLAEKDKLLGYQNCYNIYSNQFIPLVTNADLLDRIYLQGLFDKHFTGGAICHINVDSKIEDVSLIEKLIETTAKMGVVYSAINMNIQECVDGHMSVGRKNLCEICGEEIINNYTRVVGFLTNTKNWHKTRREEDYPHRQWYSSIEVNKK
jgi:ribonucleoside-triphosphate reductase